MKRALLPLLSLTAVAGYAQLSQSATWATTAANNYRTVPNVTYLTAGGTDLKLDVYQKRNVQGPQPTLIYMHGGFWVAGNKEGAVAMLLPWMEMGWNVVNVEYRLGPVALAPAALEDCLCALRFLTTQANATAYNIDVNRIVVMGESAGGHLALSLGMVPDSANLDLECAAATPLPKVAAVLNWFGITDVGDVIDGPNRRPAATRWSAACPTGWKSPRGSRP
jgi:acetyl esterase/lipase